ncbi:hypothetical protein A1O7_00242 [Cladophialophora yegresii CBS 114405]|uniref:Uncharacterized protein n=1 Tax=Cladophialophora yegresii CBS 114405 TaxID=1182544 RepID=W9W746_9EURO|nr:uncharacterized protein A1O7_00242 [Cladophialophora yegresii CBS 114405]EXJ63907.1 hypothetical protein A1O7_00242 [Cladophialophora yegresii CBS 114405]
MSLADGLVDVHRCTSPTRPSSSWTTDSLFADSAISVQTPALQKETYPFGSGDAPRECAIADRLSGLVSEIWACEQDGGIRGEKQRKITRAVEAIEAALERDSLSEEGSEAETTLPTQPPITPEPPTTPITVSDLESIRTCLAATVESMRMRQQEQRHLHHLTTEKLEAVAQKCIQQETRLREFSGEIASLKEDNQFLSQENQVLHVQLSNAQSECARKEIAIKAMSSAVSGLEGYVNGSPVPKRPADSPRIVYRGKGRFRGRYYADEAVKEPMGDDLDVPADPKALHEGVTAWLRGFRDVEEELRSAQGSAKGARAKQPQIKPRIFQDDWGEFETATST